jgi:hypothetical protein
MGGKIPGLMRININIFSLLIESQESDPPEPTLLNGRC